nr:MAG TPA: hypothetical protein [Caudoviricetes sp.]
MNLLSLNCYRCGLWHVNVAAGRTRFDGMLLVRPHVYIIYNIYLTHYWNYMLCHRIVPVRVIGGFVIQSMAVARCETCCGFVSSSSFYICLGVKAWRYGLRMDAAFVKHGLFIHVRYLW